MMSALLWALTLSCAMGAEPPKATITGGADTSWRNYSWTVTNEHSSPIVYVEFPYDAVLLFFAPQGWQTECGPKTGAGRKRGAETCAARASSPTSGIPRGAAAKFGMRLSRASARRGPGTALIRFADGNEVQVGGVEVPQRESVGDKYVALIALGVAFVMWVVVRAVRRSRTSKTGEDEPSTHHG